MADEFIGLENIEASNTPHVTIGNPDSQDELSDDQRTPTDPFKITVHVIDNTTPIVLLFGAPSSGKTMSLVRLGKYLRKQGYSLQVETNFCTDAWEYASNAAKFNDMLGTTEALQGTGHNDFLFVKVSDEKGRPVCQILEGAGEDYFPSIVAPGEDVSRVPFPSYMTGIFNGNNKKIWIFLAEPDWAIPYERKQDYVSRIPYCRNQYIANKDKAIILYNKVDKTNHVHGPGKVDVSATMKSCNDEYRGLFDIFKNPSPNPFASKYTCKFVPFSTGIYGQTIPGRPQHYDASHDKYPDDLWAAIVKCIKG